MNCIIVHVGWRRVELMEKHWEALIEGESSNAASSSSGKQG